MAHKVNFFLKKPAGNGLSLIYLQFQWQGNRLRRSTTQSIHPKMWDGLRQRVKINSVTTKDGKHYINDLLRNMEDVVTAAFAKESAKGPTPTIAQIDAYLDVFFNVNQPAEIEPEPVQKEKPTLYGLIDMFLRNEITPKGKLKSEATLKTYRTTLGHLKSFERTDVPINFETITLEWFYRFIKYLRGKGLKNNSLAKNIGVLKVFMGEGVDLGYNTTSYDFRLKRFSVSQELVDTVYLSEEEVLKIYNCDVSHNVNLENVKDAFVIACFTGLRYSDFSSLKPSHFQNIGGEMFIRKVTEKTKEEVIIPLHDTVLKILEKYKQKPGGVPRTPSNPVFNKMIKVVARLAGLTETGKLESMPEKEFCECISSHTGRRTFATNAYLSNVPTLDVMRITGHKSEKNFLRYVRLSKLHAAQRISMHYKKITGSHLKVAI